MLGLYVHIPFCAAICSYCNFNRGLFDAALSASYVDALTAEIAAAGAALSRRPADTLYFGGGTPSILAPGQVARVVDACARAFALSADCEITLEVNPETATADRLATFRAAGVNRLSIGVQSFRDEELARLSRLHSADRARAAFGDARAAGFDNVSLDLMMWLPGQSLAEWLVSVDEAAALAPDHLSLYILEVYPNAPLRDEMARARWSQAPDDDAAAMYEEAMERLEAAGYEQYEISNVARPGRRSRHNLKYWSDGEWIGLGCGAHSTLAGVRWKNVSATEDYIARLGRGVTTAVDVRRLSADERIGEALMTGLRLADGVDEAGMLARYGVDVWARYGRDLVSSLEAGLLLRKNGRMSLTRRGMLLAHEVMVAFV
jgi:oxygen-independent coproporphyrinogen-3 oxidase